MPLNKYEPRHGFSDGDEWCPYCGEFWFPHRVNETCIDRHGTEYESIADGDPDDGPYFCPECYKRVRTMQLKRENASLRAFE